ncbi:U7 snRNA-associated Sm-like protein LSm11 [Oppia nitens]|uniref:U7 snRNA-associated Sm-like protein LSm11 n=1 Tax=Oppia nitens TaxID=1686743 RepID=UPI0023D9F990|nr:U7 snRNA-associated Sm-like protein LSm11 [Oppia nitens]
MADMKSEESETNNHFVKSSSVLQNVCDLQSETFDPKISLMSCDDRVIVPVTSAHTFNNIDEYFNKSFGKSNALKSLLSKSDTKCEPIIKRTLQIEPIVTKHKLRELPTVLTKMKSSLNGPNSLLLKCLNNRIKVLIRRRKSVKLFNERFGWICGLLVAFDKHHNLCLTDVDEKYQRLSPNNKTIDVCNHFKQVLIRGDNVVIICFK